MTIRQTTRTPLVDGDPFLGEVDETSFHAFPHLVRSTAITKRSAIIGAIAETASRIDAVLTPLVSHRSRLEQIESWEPWWEWQAETTPTISELPRLVDEALAAIADLQRWLRCSQAEAASLAGIAERTIPNWKSGRNPHPSSVRKLFATHGFLRSLTLHLGRDEMLLWLNTESREGMARIDLLRQDDGLTRTVREARSILFPAPPRRGFLSSEPQEDSEEQPPALAAAYPESAGRDVRHATHIP